MKVYFYNVFVDIKIDYLEEITVDLNNEYHIDEIEKDHLIARYPHLILEDVIDIFNMYCRSIREEFSSTGFNAYHIGNGETIWQTFYCEHTDTENMLWQLFDAVIKEIHRCRVEHDYENELYDTALNVLSAFLFTYRNDFKKKSNKEFVEYLFQFNSPHSRRSDYSFFCEIEDIYYMLRNEWPEIFYQKPLTKEDYDAIAMIKSFYSNDKGDVAIS